MVARLQHRHASLTRSCRLRPRAEAHAGDKFFASEHIGPPPRGCNLIYAGAFQRLGVHTPRRALTAGPAPGGPTRRLTSRR